MDNKTDRVRPLLLYVYRSADAFTRDAQSHALLEIGGVSSAAEAGAACSHAEPYAHEVPPKWEKEGYGGIFCLRSARKTIAKAS